MPSSVSIFSSSLFKSDGKKEDGDQTSVTSTCSLKLANAHAASMQISKDQCNLDMSLAERKHSEICLDTNVQINGPGWIGIKTWTDESGMFGPIFEGVSNLVRFDDKKIAWMHSTG